MVKNVPDDISSQGIQLSVAESALQSLLPDHCKLELNANHRMLSLLSTNVPHILAQEQFTRNEWSILLTILVSYPYYAPYETLLASLTSLSPSECRKSLQQAQQLGSKTLKRELKPIHRALSGVRAKLNKLHPHLKISLLHDVGYVLVAPYDKGP